MTTTPVADPAELKRFLDAHPDTEYVDAMLIDLCGIVRGKRYPRGDLEKLHRSGLQIPYSVYFLDVTGDCLDPCERGMNDGDPDGIAMPLPDTLVPVPWAEHPSAQVLMTMREDPRAPSMVDPRNVAVAVQRGLEALGVHAVTAFELEFYLLDRERDTDGRPQPPRLPVTGKRENSTQVYGLDELDGFAALLRDVDQACRVQQIPASVTTSEYAPGQYEINLRHQLSPIISADHCGLFKRAVKRVAQGHGVEATFMSKPFSDTTGNGMHLHISLLDSDGGNVFDDGTELGSETLRHAIGGLMATMAESMAIFAPNINAFRRFDLNLFVPVTKSWGGNNRSVAFRVPTGDGENRRIEHRVAGADANPYLALAAVLAGVHHGIVNKIDPGPPSTGNAGREVDPDLPRSLEAAIDRLQDGTILSQYIAKEYLDLYCDAKRKELKKFNDYISPREFDWYL